MRIKKNNRFLWIVLLLVLVASFVFVEPTVAAVGAKDILAKVTERYSTIDTLSARFKQVAFYQQLNRRSVSEGRVFLKGPLKDGTEEIPAKMRWEYEFPTKDVIVSNGVTLWMYQPDIMQVVETDASRGPLPIIMRLLTGFSGIEGTVGGELEDDFLIDIIREGKESWGVSMAPTYGETSFNRLVVKINKNSFLVEGVKVVDPYGVETTVSLKDIKINLGLKDRIFRFDAPKGVTVVRP